MPVRIWNARHSDYKSERARGSTSNAYVTNIKGKLAGSREEIGDIQGAMRSRLIGVVYYDNILRPICSVKENHIYGFNNDFYAYNFNNQLIEHIVTHNSSSQSQIVMINKYEYDHHGRLLNEKQKIANQPTITLRSFAYNELGDIISVFLHGDEDGQNFNQKIDQTYNIRGWLRKINNPTALEDDLFAFELRYENPSTSGQISVDPNYNGNISQMLWNSKFDKPRAYGFTYDDLNRLTSTKYGDGISFNSSPDYFATSYSYDYNGNITSLVRKSNNIEITDFTYAYKNDGKSNQISYINNNNALVIYPPRKPLPYLYDANGSMYRDPSKQMSISYNHLNLPIGVLIGPDDEINYTYTHTGLKLRKTVETLNSAGDYTADYCGNFLYRDNELITIFTPAGKIVPIEYAGETFWQYEYDMKDHLGNTRLVFAAHDNGHPEVLQQTSYYPYGKIMQQQNFQGTDANENKNLFNGKEFQDDVLAGINLDWYDFGARMYDPEICRWHVMDPLAVLSPNYSPYRFGFDNPIMFTDPSGMYEEDGDSPIYDYEGNFLGYDSWGWLGPDIFMSETAFNFLGGKGMSHKAAMDGGSTIDEMTDEEALYFANYGLSNYLENSNRVQNEFNAYLDDMQYDAYHLNYDLGDLEVQIPANYTSLNTIYEHVYGSPESEIVTSVSATSGIIGTQQLKYAKYFGVLGSIGDGISILGAASNLSQNPSNSQYYVDGAIALVGIWSGPGDLISLAYLVALKAAEADPRHEKVSRQVIIYR